MTDKPLPADVFRAMGGRIDKNPEEFAGAFCIVAPDGSILSHAFFDPTGDVASFWGFVNSAVQVAGAEAVSKAEGYQAGGARRR